MTIEDARAAALRLLKFRPRSESELKERLAQKGFQETVVEIVVEDLRRKGFVGDAQFARYFAAQQSASKPVGRRLLMNRLKAKGVQPELAQQAVELAMEGRDDLALARKAAGKRAAALAGLPRAAAERRLFGYLSRRGFSGDVVWKVVKETTQSHPHESEDQKDSRFRGNDRV